MQTLCEQIFANVDHCSMTSVAAAPEPKPMTSETFDGKHNFRVMEWHCWRKPITMSQADMEQLAETRGKAMQRYKEKKKTRRQYPLSSLFLLLLKYFVCALKSCLAVCYYYFFF